VTVILWGSFETFAIRPIILNSDFKILHEFWNHLASYKDTRNVLGCLQLLATEPVCCKIFLDGGAPGEADKKNWIAKFLELYGNFYQVDQHRFETKQEKTMICRYTIALIFANILLHVEKAKSLDPSYESTIVEHAQKLTAIQQTVEHFTTTYTASQICQKEGQSTSWQSIKPFAHLIQAQQEVVAVMGAMSLAQLSKRKINRLVMEEERLFPMMSCIQWCPASKRVRELGTEIWASILEHVTEPPTLTAMCLWQARRNGQVNHETFTEYFELYVQFSEQ
jgi:hypothetical protein